MQVIDEASTATAFASTSKRRPVPELRHVILMKYGVHAGEQTDSIISRKKADLETFGCFFWGYGGSLCHPTNQVQLFGKEIEDLWLALIPTRSGLYNDPAPATYFSGSGNDWEDLPTGMKVVGSKHAIVCSDLIPCQLTVNLNDFAIAVGPSVGKPAGDYLRGRVDKACVRPIEGARSGTEALAQIDFLCKVSRPYAVFLR